MTRRPFLSLARVVAGLAVIFAVSGCVTMSLADRIAALMREAFTALQAKRYDEAIGKYQQVVSQDAKHWPAYLGLARGFIGKGSWAQAVQSGRQAYQLSPSGQDVVPVFAEALFGGGVDALKGGKFTDAVGMFVDYIKIQPNNASAYMNLGKSFLGTRDFRGALDAFVKGFGVASGPERNEFIRSFFDGGMQAFAQNDYRSAIGFFTETVKAQPTHVSAYLNMGKSFLQTKEYGPALDSFVKGLGAGAGGNDRNELVRGLFDGGKQALSGNDYRGAIGFLREYVKSDRGNVNAYLDLAKSYWNAGDRGEALNSFREVLRLNPTNSEALRFMLQR